MNTILEKATGLKAFDLPEETRTQARKVLEEAAELMVAVDDWEAPSDDAQATWAHMLDEYAQVLQAMVNLQASVGFTDADLREACMAVNARHVADGRVSR